MENDQTRIEHIRVLLEHLKNSETNDEYFARIRSMLKSISQDLGCEFTGPDSPYINIYLKQPSPRLICQIMYGNNIERLSDEQIQSLMIENLEKMNQAIS